MFGTLGAPEVIILVLVGAASIFWIWMLFDAVHNGNLTTRERRFWVLLIALTHTLGAASYLLNRPRPGTGGLLARNSR